MNEFVTQHMNNPALWAAVAAIVVFAALFSIEKLSEQPFFGGKKRRAPLEEHYLHGEITTSEYEKLKAPGERLGG